ATETASGPSTRPAVDANVKRHVFVPATREAASDVRVVDDCIRVTSVASTRKVAAASSAAPSAVPPAGLSIVAVGVTTASAALKPVPALPALSVQPPASVRVAAPGVTAENAPLAKRK